MDVLLSDGDIKINDAGDIELTDSTRQAVLIRLRWLLGEWRLGPSIGFPWFEEVLVKNPNTAKISLLLTEEIMKVDGVTSAQVTKFSVDPATRIAYVAFTFTTDEDTYWEEVELDV